MNRSNNIIKSKTSIPILVQRIRPTRAKSYGTRIGDILGGI